MRKINNELIGEKRLSWEEKQIVVKKSSFEKYGFILKEEKRSNLKSGQKELIEKKRVNFERRHI